MNCPHYDLVAQPDRRLAICAECGAVIRVQIAGLPVEEFYDQQTTVISEEGGDVAFDWPGEG